MPALEELNAARRAAPELDGQPWVRSDDPMAIPAAEEGEAGLPEIPALDRPIEIQLAAVKQYVDAGAAVVIDAREAEEYAAGHIPGALAFSYDEATGDPERLARLAASREPLIVYCGGGTCELSLSLAWELIFAGHTRVTVFMGGFPEWQAAGFPVERGGRAAP
jgi:3-mercaptopyruvate sulfurtransferase SseA